MADDVKPRRRYDGSRRQDAAQQTQREVLAAARRLFVEHGYAATSVRQIADEAGVSVQTLYGGFTNKAGILKRLGDVAVVGDDEPVALADRSVVAEMQAMDDPYAVLARNAAMVRGIWDRFGDLLPVLRSAAAVEPEVADEQHRNVVVNRRAGMGHLVGLLSGLQALRPGLEAGEAADVAWALCGPDVYEALVLVRGWTSDRYEAWLAETLQGALLAPRRGRKR